MLKVSGLIIALLLIYPISDRLLDKVQFKISKVVLAYLSWIGSFLWATIGFFITLLLLFNIKSAFCMYEGWWADRPTKLKTIDVYNLEMDLNFDRERDFVEESNSFSVTVEYENIFGIKRIHEHYTTCYNTCGTNMNDLVWIYGPKGQHVNELSDDKYSMMSKLIKEKLEEYWDEY